MGLQLRLHELVAKDETNTGGTEWFSDDMYLGGVGLALVGPDAKPSAHKVPFFKVGTFDDGDREEFDPPRLFDKFGFGSAVFPKDITFAFVLVERDKGKMNEYLDELYKQLKAEADKKFDEVSEGENDDSWVDDAIELAKEIIRVGYQQWKGDEVFEPQTIALRVESQAHTWNGKTSSPLEAVDFRGHGGHYVLKYDWNMDLD